MRGAWQVVTKLSEYLQSAPCTQPTKQDKAQITITKANLDLCTNASNLECSQKKMKENTHRLKVLQHTCFVPGRVQMQPAKLGLSNSLNAGVYQVTLVINDTRRKAASAEVVD